MGKLEEHQEQNKKVFDDHKKIVFDVMDAENELRDAVAEEKSQVSNALFRVTIAPQTQTYADIEVIDRLIASGVIPASKRGEIVKTVDRPARVNISKIGNM